MKKTCANSKDRIVLIPSENALYFQPERTAQRYYLCDATRLIRSCFCEQGRWDTEDACSLSIGQMYRIDRRLGVAKLHRRTGYRTRQPKGGLLEHLPSQINYVIRYVINDEQSSQPIRCLLDDLIPCME